MQLRELYQEIGVDYDEVLAYFRKEDRLKRYLAQTIDDPAFAALDEAMASQSYDEAFRAAHTIKGMSMNLLIKPLVDASVGLVEALRDDQPDEAVAAERHRAFKEASEKVAALVRGLS